MAPLRPARPTPLAIALWLQIHRGDEGFLRNVRLADPSGEVSTTRAIAEFGWRADFRIETDSSGFPLHFVFARFGIPRNRAP